MMDKRKKGYKIHHSLKPLTSDSKFAFHSIYKTTPQLPISYFFTPQTLCREICINNLVLHYSQHDDDVAQKQYLAFCFIAGTYEW